MIDMTENWQEQRAQLNHRVEQLRQQGICYTCYDIETGELFRDQHVVYEDEQFRIALELYPRMRGHTIVVYKPHREDISELPEDEAGRVFEVCVQVVKAIKVALGAEKVYLNTMCDGEINHLHLQLFPRYAGDPLGSTRFVAPRQPLVDGDEIARRIRSALLPAMAPG